MRRLPWQQVAAHAWSHTYLQVARTFILPHIDISSLKELPGTNPAALPPPATLAASNVYSTAESILAAWLEAQVKKMLPRAARRIVAFDSGLHDCVAFCAAVAAHWPPAVRALQQLALPTANAAVSAADCRANARVLLAMLDDLQCPLRTAGPEPLSAERVATAHCADMVLLSAYLFSWLPQLIPRSTIEFSGKLQESQTQMVEISNPSKKAISYSVRLQGHVDFSLDQQSLRVEAGCTAACAVQCKPSTGVTQSAYLVLASRRDGAAVAATLVFQLVSKVQPTRPLQF